jgi:hypothetical protein
MSIETGVLISFDGHPIHWHLPPGRSCGYLPDSRDLWDIIWENRASLDGFAHSHPGFGIPSPSHEDVTTFAAVELALGRNLKWWITSANSTILLVRIGNNYQPDFVSQEPNWIRKLRELSGFNPYVS